MPVPAVGGIHYIDPLARTPEGDLPPVGRPRRELIHRGRVTECMPVTAVHIHYLDADRAKTPERVDTFVVGKRQLRAVRRPGGVVLLRQRVGQLRLVGTV